MLQSRPRHQHPHLLPRTLQTTQTQTTHLLISAKASAHQVRWRGVYQSILGVFFFCASVCKICCAGMHVPSLFCLGQCSHFFAHKLCCLYAATAPAFSSKIAQKWGVSSTDTLQKVPTAALPKATSSTSLPKPSAAAGYSFLFYFDWGLHLRTHAQLLTGRANEVAWLWAL